MNPFDGRNRRRVFRLRLPIDSHLKATIGGESYAVMEVAEFSICVTSEDVNNDNGQCEGVLHWSDGHQSNFLGKMGHVRNGERVIMNIQGIDMQDVITEQRKLLARFPALRDWRESA